MLNDSNPKLKEGSRKGGEEPRVLARMIHGEGRARRGLRALTGGRSAFRSGYETCGLGALSVGTAILLVLMAVRVRQIEWRGIKYNLGGPRKVHLLHYTPFRPHCAAQDARVSL